MRQKEEKHDSRLYSGSLSAAVGRFDNDSPSRRKLCRAFLIDSYSCAFRYLFHHQDPASSHSDVPGNASADNREKNFFKKGRAVRPAVPDCIHCHTGGHGKSGRRSGCHLSRRRRGSFLDVGTGAARFFYCFYRSNPGTAPQRTRSPVRRLPGRSIICL